MHLLWSMPLAAEIVSQMPLEVMELLLRLLAENQALRADETVWKQKNTREWLWFLCGRKAAFFMVHQSRS